MSIRPKTIRRLLILLLAFAAAAGAISIWLLISQHRQRGQIAQLRQEAWSAYDARDYPHAVGLFSEYINRSHSQNNDPDSIFAYGRSRASVPLPNGSHTFEAIHIFQHYLELRPDDPRDAEHELLKLFTRVQYDREAKTLADVLLVKNPEDVEALRAKAEALSHERNFAEALVVCQRINRIAPLNLKWQCFELGTMEALKRPPEQVVANAEALQKEHPGDARFEALLALAFEYAKDDAAAKKAIERAAQLPPPDADSVLSIVAILDSKQDRALADDLLARAMATDHDPRLLGLVAERLWQQQHRAELLAKLKDLDPKLPAASTALLGYKALALCELGQPGEAQPLIDTLASRQDDSSIAWTSALRARMGAATAPAAETIRKYREAIAHERTGAVFHFLLGQEYASIGDVDQARRELLVAGSSIAPTWALPYTQASWLLCQAGQFRDALECADVARQRAPGDGAAIKAYAVASYGILMQSGHSDDADQRAALLRFIEEIQNHVRNEPDTLPLYVSLLAQQGQRDSAIQVIKDALAADPSPPVEALLKLAQISFQEHLDLEDQIINRAEKLGGVTPAIASARAFLLYRAGKTPEALELFKSGRQSHPGEVDWQLAEAQFRDLIGDPAAPRQWVQIANAHPADLHVQYALLASPSRATDRAMWRAAIDRVKTLVGPDSQVWKIDDARWQLSGKPSGKALDALIASLQQIVRDSPSFPDPHQLLADALLRSGRADATVKATEELTAANELQPANPQTSRQLAGLLLQQGKLDKALALVEGVAKQPSLPPEQRTWAAGMYSDLGYPDRAVALLTDPTAPPNVLRDAMLARVYRRAGRNAQANAAYRKLLEDAAPDPNALADAATFFAATRQRDLVDKCVSLLQNLHPDPSALELLRGNLEELMGAPEKAVAHLQAAIKADPHSAQAWQEMAGYWLRQGKLEEADRAAADGFVSAPQSPALAAMRTQIARLRVTGLEGLASIIQIISHSPLDAPADQLLGLLNQAKQRNDPPDQVASDLRQLADRYEACIPIQELLVQRYIGLGRYKEAAQIASRAGQMAPNDPAPLRLLFDVYRSAGNWEAARQAAEQWRQRDADNPVEADIAIAVTYLSQPIPDPQAALQKLAGYESDSAPETLRRAALQYYCHALILAGRSDQAAGLLKPLLAESPQWRIAWLMLAAAHKDAGSASQWLEQVVDLLSADSVSEQLALADAWEQIARRFDLAEGYERALRILQPLAARQPIVPAALRARARIEVLLERYARAEAALREFLRASPNDPGAQNDLAYALLMQGGQERLQEARQLALTAVNSSASNSTFYDTLARIQLQLGHRAAAIKAFHIALEKDANNVEAMIGLADLLQGGAPDREELRSLFTRINSALAAGTPVPNQLRKQLERVKNAMSSL